MKQTVLLIGAGGQLARELQRTIPQGVHCVPVTRAQLDIGDVHSVNGIVAAQKPQLVINAAAYTAVDKAESEPLAAQTSNVDGPAALALVCAREAVRLIHISTDFVFDGTASQPYLPESSTALLGVYARSKRDGELAVQHALPTALILRTGWVYSRFGSNFVKTMLRLMSERDELAVVADQVGTPTWAHGLAKTIWAAADKPQLHGIYHWSDAGVCSWYDFAVAIYEESLALGLLARSVRIKPIAASEYPTPAQRPAYSVLDKRSTWRDLSVEAVHWRQHLRAMLADLQEHADG